MVGFATRFNTFSENVAKDTRDLNKLGWEISIGAFEGSYSIEARIALHKLNFGDNRETSI